jgi:DNA-binding SARP family transcriptional activator
MMTPLRIYLCGRLAIEHDQTVVRERDFPARQGRRLWAYLVLRRRGPVGREDLAEAIWGDDVPDAWDSTLNGVISRTRAMLRPFAPALPELGIRGEIGRYQLILPHQTVLDHERARTALHTAETALRRDDWPLALSESRVAMEIAARGFLDGEDAPWIEGQRRALADLRLHATETSIEADLGRGQFATAEREAELLIAFAPLHEHGYRLLMRAIAGRGNRARLPEVMDRCRRVLGSQAQLAPAPETILLFRQLLESGTTKTIPSNNMT